MRRSIKLNKFYTKTKWLHVIILC